MTSISEIQQDYTLLEGSLNGNSNSQKKFYEKYAPKMFAVCLRYMGNEDDAQDTLQDGFIKVFLRLSEFKNEGSLEGWIRRIIVNTCLDTIRKKQKSKLNVEISETTYFLGYTDIGYQNIELQELMGIIQSMPKGYKVVFTMFIIEGYSHKEIGEKLNITESTSKSQYFRARSFLREKIEKIYK